MLLIIEYTDIQDKFAIPNFQTEDEIQFILRLAR